MGTIYWAYIGIMENDMETIIMGTNYIGVEGHSFMGDEIGITIGSLKHQSIYGLGPRVRSPTREL